MNDYSFIKEVIKEKPFDKKAFFTKAALIVLGAVLFGIIGGRHGRWQGSSPAEY